MSAEMAGDLEPDLDPNRAEKDPWKEEPSLSPGQLADSYFQEARDFIQAQIVTSMNDGFFPPNVASSLFKQFCDHFSRIGHIAKGGKLPSDLPTACSSALQITILAYAAGARNVEYMTRRNDVERIKKIEGAARAARARSGKQQKSGGNEAEEFLMQLAQHHTQAKEDWSRRSDRVKIAERIKPLFDAKCDELLAQRKTSGRVSKSVDAIEKWLMRRTSTKPSDG